MRFAKLWALVGSGPGIAPQYDSYGPVERAMLSEEEASTVDKNLDKAGFATMQESLLVKAARDMVFTTLTVKFENGDEHKVKFAGGTMPQSVQEVIDLAMRFPQD